MAWCKMKQWVTFELFSTESYKENKTKQVCTTVGKVIIFLRKKVASFLVEDLLYIHAVHENML